MGARYDSYDRKIDQRKQELQDIQWGIDLINERGLYGKGYHPAVKILQHELDKKTKNLQRIREHAGEL